MRELIGHPSRKSSLLAVWGLVAVMLAVCACAAPASEPTDSEQAPAVSYELNLRSPAEPSFTVKCTFEMRRGERITMSPYEPGEWIGEVANRSVDLRVEGREDVAVGQAPDGWTLSAEADGPVSVVYGVDFLSSEGKEGGAGAEPAGPEGTTGPAEPVPDEVGAVAEAEGGEPGDEADGTLEAELPIFSPDMAVLPGDDVFLTPGVGEEQLSQSYAVEVRVPQGNELAAPWENGTGVQYRVDSPGRLRENLLTWGALRKYDMSIDSNELEVVISESGRPSSKDEVDKYNNVISDIMREALDVFGNMPDLGKTQKVVFICVGPEELDLKGSHSTSRRDSVLFFNDSAKIEGSRAVTASRAVFGIWNGYGIVPAEGSQGRDVMWFGEGLGRYYGPLLANRAGLLTARGAWGRFSRQYAVYASQPGAGDLSLVEAAGTDGCGELLASKGSLACALLDSRIIDKSGASADLDDLLSELLQERNGYLGKRYTLNDLEEYLEDLSRDGWADYLNQLVNGTGWVNLADISSSMLFEDTGGPPGSGSSSSWLWLILVLALIIVIPIIFTPYIRKAARIDTSWTPSEGDEAGEDAEVPWEDVWDEKDEE